MDGFEEWVILEDARVSEGASADALRAVLAEALALDDARVTGSGAEALRALLSPESTRPASSASAEPQDLAFYWEDDQGSNQEIPLRDLPSLIASGAVSDLTTVWMDGFEEWVILEDARVSEGASADALRAVLAEVEDATPEPVFYYERESDGENEETTLAALGGLVASGTVSDDTRVWMEGLEDWVSFAEAKEQLGGVLEV